MKDERNQNEQMEILRLMLRILFKKHFEKNTFQFDQTNLAQVQSDELLVS